MNEQDREIALYEKESGKKARTKSGKYSAAFQKWWLNYKPDSIRKLQDMLEVSDRISLSMIRETLEMSKKEFNEKIFQWARDYNFRIDGDYIVVQNKSDSIGKPQEPILNAGSTKKVDYHGTPLLRYEHDVILALEEIVGGVIPKVDDVNFVNSDTFGFVAQENHVVQLAFNDKNLTSLPESIENLTRLTELRLSSNKIAKIKGLEALVNLKELDLNFNEITEIKGLETLVNLEEYLISPIPKKRGRPKGVKNGQGKNRKKKKPKKKRGRKGIFAHFDQGKRGYAKIDPFRKTLRLVKDVSPAVAAAFGETKDLFWHKSISK